MDQQQAEATKKKLAEYDRLKAENNRIEATLNQLRHGQNAFNEFILDYGGAHTLLFPNSKQKMVVPREFTRPAITLNPQMGADLKALLIALLDRQYVWNEAEMAKL